MRAVLLALFTTLMAIHTFAQPNKDGIDGIYYNLNISSLTAEVTFCHFYDDDAENSYLYDGAYWDYAYSQYKYRGELTIPESVTYDGKTYKVTALGSNSMYGCNGLIKLNLPATLATFGDGWTTGCSLLQAVTIDANNPTYRVENGIVLKGNDIYYVPMGIAGTVTVPECVKSISNEVFGNHKSISKIVLHNGITSIQEGAFNGCSALSEINIPTSVTAIEGRTFYNCTSLKTIIIPSNVKSIGVHAFTGSALETVTLSEGLTTIGNYAFYNITSLESINLPNSLTSIGNNAFKGCSDIKALHFGKNLKSIGENALEGINADSYTVHEENTLYSCVSGIVYNKAKSELAFIPKSFPDEVTIPGTLNEIPEGLFSWHNNITTATIEEGIKEIPDDMFTNCQGLTTVNIPASVESISWTAFDWCMALESVNISSDNATYSCVGPLILTDNGTKIDLCLPGAAEVVVPATVTSLYGDVFIVCENLRSLTFQTDTPPAFEETLDFLELGENDKCTIYVPKGAENAYASAFGLDISSIKSSSPTSIEEATGHSKVRNSRLISEKGKIIIQKEGDKYSLYGTKIM